MSEKLNIKQMAESLLEAVGSHDEICSIDEPCPCLEKIEVFLQEIASRCAQIAEQESDCCGAGEDHVFHTSEEIADKIEKEFLK